MSEYKPLSSIIEADLLNDDECILGYMAGLRLEPEPGSDKSKSFWHGWRNGMIDKGMLPIDESAANLAKEFVRRARAH